MEELKVVVFKVGKDEYGIDISRVLGIEKLTDDIVNVPNAPAFVKGIINLRGEVVPIYGLADKFGINLGDTDLKEQNFIITKSGDVTIGILVDAVQEIKNTDDSVVCELPTIIHSDNTKYIDKVINRDGKLIIVLNVDCLISEDEKNQIENIVNN